MKDARSESALALRRGRATWAPSLGYAVWRGIRALALVAASALLTVQAQAQPNLVVVLIDDMGWRDTGFAGNKTTQTPNLDRLAREGIIFTEAYAAAPNCAPTRACLMTGQYTPRHGVYTVVDERHSPGQPTHKIMAAESRPELATEAVTVAELLQDAGYATGMVGMWNLGRGKRGPCTPTGQGFDLYVEPKGIGFERDAYFNAKGEYLTDKLTDAAIDFVQKQRGPFFLYAAYHAVHGPFDPKPELLRSSPGSPRPEGRSTKPSRLPRQPLPNDSTPSADLRWPRGEAALLKEPNHGSGEDAAYAATIEALDASIGRLVAALPENTVLIFTSDNGGTGRYVKPLRGGKGALYEGGLRVPAFAWGSGIKPNQKSAEPISTIDILPTLLELAGIPLTAQVDGLSLMPLWNDTSLERDALFWHFPCYVGPGVPASAMRQGTYKLIQFFEDGELQLYDLSEDPEENNNLARDEPELTLRLHKRLEQWQANLDAARPTAPNPNYDPSAVKQRGRGQKNKERRKR